MCVSNTLALFFFFLLKKFFSFIFISWRLIILQYCSGFCHTLTWISHGVTCIPHPDPPSHLPLHQIPLGLPSAPGPSTCLMHPTCSSVLQRAYTNVHSPCSLWKAPFLFSTSSPALNIVSFLVYVNLLGGKWYFSGDLIGNFQITGLVKHLFVCALATGCPLVKGASSSLVHFSN